MEAVKMHLDWPKSLRCSVTLAEALLLQTPTHTPALFLYIYPVNYFDFYCSHNLMLAGLELYLYSLFPWAAVMHKARKEVLLLFIPMCVQQPLARVFIKVWCQIVPDHRSWYLSWLLHRKV